MKSPNWCIVTGVSGGIGSAICKKLKQDNYGIIGIDIVDTQSDYCDFFFQGDVSRSHDLLKIAEFLKDKGMSLDGYINNAAKQWEGPLSLMPEETWDEVISVNLKAIYLSVKLFLPYFSSPASLINISSVHAKATSTGIAAYAASKGGVSALTRSLAIELGTSGIRVNSILPGAIDTEMLRKGLSRNGDYKTARNKLVEKSPLKRIGTPDDVAELAHFLLDHSKSSNITGQEFVCDSGVLACLASE